MADLDVARSLVAAGIPVVVCRPHTHSRRCLGNCRKELDQPAGWSTVTAGECRERLETFRPGTDVLAMVSGHGIDVVDEDPKSGGSLDNMPPFEYFGEVRTPSGGRHRYVASTFYGKVHGFSTSAGFVGDYAGGTASAGGRLLVYLPGSTRPKYPNRSYEWVDPLDIEAALDSLPDPDLVNTLEAAGASMSAVAGTTAVAVHEAWEWLEALPDRTDECEYGRSAVSALLLEATRTDPGDPLRGRHGWLSRAVTRLVELSSTGCVDRADFEAVGRVFREIKPEAESDEEIRAVQWAIANAKGRSGCLLHTSGGVALEADTNQENDFWECRPFLSHMRAFAQARLAGPYATLLVALTQVSGAIDYRWVLPPTVGRAAPLNLYTCLVGDSSGGKGAATGAAQDAIQFVNADPAEWHKPGSGEGLVSLYIKSDKDGEEIIRRAVILDVPEAAQLKSLVQRRGQTFDSLITSGWSGEPLGFSYRSVDSRGTVPKLAYRLSMVIGAQFGMAESILAMEQIGLPQRMMWSSVFDPHPVDVDEPDPFPIVLPELPALIPPEGVRVSLAPIAKARVRDVRKQALRGEGLPDGIEGHDLQTRLRVACVLAFVDGRSEMNDEDWELSDHLFRISRDARNLVRNKQSKREEKQAIARVAGQRRAETFVQATRMDEAFEALQAQEKSHREKRLHPRSDCKRKCYRNALNKRFPDLNAVEVIDAYLYR